MILSNLALGLQLSDQFGRHAGAAAVAAVEELLGDYAIADDTWAVLAQSWSEAQLIEFPMMVGQYVATAFIQNSLRVRMAAENRGLSHR